MLETRWSTTEGSPIIAINANPNENMTWESTGWAYVEKVWSVFDRVGRVVFRGCISDHDTNSSRSVDEDT